MPYTIHLPISLQLADASVPTSETHACNTGKVVLRAHPPSRNGAAPHQKLGGYTGQAPREQRPRIQEEASLVRSTTTVATLVECLAQGIVPQEAWFRHVVNIFDIHLSWVIPLMDDPSRNMVNIILYVAEQCKIYYPPSEIEPMLNMFLPLLTRDVCHFASESHNYVQCTHVDVHYYRACVRVIFTFEALPSIHAVSLQTLGRSQFSCECWLFYRETLL